MWYNVRRGFATAQVESQSKAKGPRFKIRRSGKAAVAAKRWCAEALPLRKWNLKARPKGLASRFAGAARRLLPPKGDAQRLCRCAGRISKKGAVEIKLFGTDAGGIILKISPGDGALRASLPEWSFYVYYVYIAAVKPQDRGSLPPLRAVSFVL